MEASKQIIEWKANEVENTMKYLERISNQIAEWRNKYSFIEMNQLSDYRKIPQAYKELIRHSVEVQKSAVVKLVNDHFESLQAKVESKIGTILEITTIGNNGFDYRFKGENGNLQIKVVNAGGWNIQVSHTRWTVSKIK